jgi:multidrug resistance efflux pump
MRKYRILIALIIVLLGILLSVYFFSNGSDAPELKTTKAERKEIQLIVSTNGIIEPIDRSEVYAPIDATVARIFHEEGARISKGQVLIQLESNPIRSSITDAKTALLEAKRQEKAATTGPLKEEIAVQDAATAEIALQLDQTNKDLEVEESLLAKGAIARAAVDSLRKQKEQLQLRLDNQKRKREDLLQRYSPDEKQWAQDKVRELTKQVQFLEKELQTESVTALRSGLLYSLEVKPGAYVTKGQLLAQINPPGKVMLRAYVDEPDLGRINKGQTVSIEWDGLPNKKWNGVVEKPAEQVVSLNNRTVGYVICSIEGEPTELIPNLNVKVGITTARKTEALVVPRSAVFSPNGKPSVLLAGGKLPQLKQVVLGLVSAEEIEILQGINAGDSVVINPLEVWK